MNERYVFTTSFTRSQTEQANDNFTVTPVGTGEVVVRLVPCCQPFLHCPPTGTHPHRRPRSSPRRDHSHLRVLLTAPKAGASLTGLLIQTGSPAPSLPCAGWLPGAAAGGFSTGWRAKQSAVRREPSLTHDVYSFIWCWLLWEPLAWPLQKQS